MIKSQLFKTVWKGFFVGGSLVFTPLFLVMMMTYPVIKPTSYFAVLAVPLVIGIQGLIVACTVVLGVSIWPVKVHDDAANDE